MKAISVRTRVTRLKKLRAFLAALPPRKFDQGTYMETNKTVAGKAFQFDTPLSIKDIQSCGTRACIAGWTCLLFGKPTTKLSYTAIGTHAQQLLGISSNVRNDLFSCGPIVHLTGNGVYKGAKAKKAALTVLDVLIASKGESLNGLTALYPTNK